jgi:hypothetical protein
MSAGMPNPACSYSTEFVIFEIGKIDFEGWMLQWNE